MEAPKIHLSSAETELMQNANIILTKNSVLQKIKFLLEDVQQNQIDFTRKNNLKEQDVFAVPPKISRGENYLGLPWLMLDYPRVSEGEHLFFIRTMFWWGNFFSSTLHVSGKYKERVITNIANSYTLPVDYYIGMNEEPWVHHFEKDNYKSISSMTKAEFDNTCHKMDHLKIAAKWPVIDWQQASTKLYESWKLLLNVSGLIS